MRQVNGMKFRLACEKAMEYFKENYGDSGFCSIQDLGECWLFEGKNKNGLVIYGKPGITINKESGKQELFCLPDEKNFELLDEAVEIVVPEEYRVTA